MGKLQPNLWVPELRHNECTGVGHQGLSGDDSCWVGKMCKPSTGCPRGRLPNRGVIRGSNEAGHILHWEKSGNHLSGS